MHGIPVYHLFWSLSIATKPDEGYLKAAVDVLNRNATGTRTGTNAD